MNRIATLKRTVGATILAVGCILVSARNTAWAADSANPNLQPVTIDPGTAAELLRLKGLLAAQQQQLEEQRRQMDELRRTLDLQQQLLEKVSAVEQPCSPDEQGCTKELPA